MAAGDAAPQSGGNVLTRKVGPLPTWGWLAIITAAGLLYYLHSKSTAATPAASTATTAAAAGVPQNVQVYQNYGGGQGQQQTYRKYAKTPSTTPSPKPVPSQPLAPAQPQGVGAPAGSGYGPVSSGGTVTTGSGAKYVNISPAQEQANIASGTPLYYQPSPGVFAVWNSQTNTPPVANGTAIFQLVG